MTETRPHRPIDPIEFAVLRHRLEEVTEEMNAGLVRAAYSPNITDRRDCSCALYLPHGEPVAQSESGTPLHLGVMPAVLRTILAVFPAAAMRPGDQYIVNTPYPEGPGHLNDITVARPVFVDGEVVAIVANQAHHVDVGGIVPASMPSHSTEIYQEGLQIPPVRLLAQGELVEDFLRLFFANIRTPAVSRGDLLAQVAANNVGHERVVALAAERGVRQLQQAMAELLDHTEREVRALIREIPAGVYHAEDEVEGPEGPLRIVVALQVHGDEVIADFTGSAEQVAAPLNCRPATVQACLAYVVNACLRPGVIPNAGSLRPLRVIAPEGSLLNATHPAPVVQSNIITSTRICDVLIRALYAAAPHLVTALSSGTQALLSAGGYDRARGEHFTYIETHGGGAGAGAAYDGESGVHTHMTNTLNTPIEVFEQAFPMRVLDYSLVPDSAGSGAHRGGFGIHKTVEFHEPTVVTIALDRTLSRPSGFAGGGDGAPAQVRHHHAGGVTRLGGRATLTVQPGDRIEIVTPGGGGWGAARSRPAEQLEADRRAGLLSAEAADAAYRLDDEKRRS